MVVSPEVSHSWRDLSEAVLRHAEASVLEVRRGLMDCGVTYLRGSVEMVAPHVVEV